MNLAIRNYSFVDMRCHVIRVISHPTDRDSRKHAVSSMLNASWPFLTMHSNDDVAIFNGIVKYEFMSCDSTSAGEITSEDILFVDDRNGPVGRMWAASVISTTGARLWTHDGYSINNMGAPGKPITTYYSTFSNFKDFIMEKFGYECSSTGWDIITRKPTVVSSTPTETPSTTSETSVPTLYDQWSADNAEAVSKWIDDGYHKKYLTLTPVHYLAAHGLLDILKTAPIVCDVDLGVSAAENNQLDVIKWLVEESTYTIDVIASCEVAAKRGFLRILKYIHNCVDGGAITATHLKEAASRGNIHVIKWAAKEGHLNYQRRRAGVYRAAIRAGHVNIVHFLRKKYEITTFAPKDIALAARAGHLTIVQMAAVHTPAVFSPSEIMSIDGIHPDVRQWVALIYDV